VRSFRWVALAQLGVGLLTLPLVLLGTVPETARPARAMLVVCWLGLAGFTYLVAPRLPWWGLDVSLGASALILGAATVNAQMAQVQVLEGFGLLVLGAFAAYTLPRTRMWVLVAISTTIYVAALVRTPLLLGPWLGVLVVALVIGNTAMVARQLDTVRDLSLTDPLTGALNRKGLQERAPGVRGVAQRSGRPTSVAVIDLDDFKAYNDTHGHAAGDALLVGLVAAWAEQLRPGDLLARIGGDEFVLVLPDADVDQTAAAVRRLERSSPSSWTVGSTTWRPDEDVLEAIARADRLMYVHKQPTARTVEDSTPRGDSG
jgi:diguanylate cyclase (GGDEF)-like protein